MKKQIVTCDRCLRELVSGKDRLYYRIERHGLPDWIVTFREDESLDICKPCLTESNLRKPKKK